MKNLKRVLYLKFARKVGRNGSDVPVPTIISEGTNVKGNIISDSVIHIDGRVDGDVSCSELVVGLKGAVYGAINTQTLHLYGTLQGKANVDRMFIAKTAKLVGDVTHNSIAIEPGAYIDGHCIRATATPVIDINDAEAETKNQSKKKQA